MRFARIVGRLSLSKAHPSIVGRRWLLGHPQSLKALIGEAPGEPEELVIIDELGTRDGDMVAFSEGGEAAFAYYPEKKPVDAYAACIIDEIVIDRNAAVALLESGGK